MRVICEDAERIASRSEAIDRLLAALRREAIYSCPQTGCYYTAGGSVEVCAGLKLKHIMQTGHRSGPIERLAGYADDLAAIGELS